MLSGPDEETGFGVDKEIFLFLRWQRMPTYRDFQRHPASSLPFPSPVACSQFSSAVREVERGSRKSERGKAGDHRAKRDGWQVASSEREREREREQPKSEPRALCLEVPRS